MSQTASISATNPCVRCSRPTIRAHLMPRAFTRLVRDGDKHMEQFSAQGAHHSRVQSATYDDEILCRGCDGVLGDLDDRAVRFCRSVRSLNPVLGHYFIAPGADTAQLVRFAASIVWRASISSRPEVAAFTLTPSISKAFEGCSFGTSAPTEWPKVALARYESHVFKNVEHFMMLPTPDHPMGHPFSCFSAGGFRWMVHLEIGDWPVGLQPTPINGSPHVTGRMLLLERTSEFEHLRRLHGQSLTQRLTKRRR
jgi:hypothetical protein